MPDSGIFVSTSLDEAGDFEVVERKGRGHPDTLADQLAVTLSRKYSIYTKERYGAILHHNFDKVGLLGGHSEVNFGDGKLTKPIRVLLNGRASNRFADEEIPVQDILTDAARSFLIDRFPMLDVETDIDIQYNVSTASSPGETEPEEFDAEGARGNWFSPRSLDDLPEQHHLASNDTSHGVGYAPLSHTERFVKDLERWLNGPYNEEHRWLGSDIKLMATRANDEIDLTAAIPQIADYVPDIGSYDENIRQIENDIEEFAEQNLPSLNVTVHTNTRDDYEAGELYLTAIGSAIESGDEGLVGRGNRTNGLITPTKPMSIEGQCGKNPVYHVGMMYNMGARMIAERIHESCGVPAEVHLVSQSGRTLTDPWKTFVLVPESADEDAVRTVVEKSLEDIPDLTDEWLAGNISLV